MKKTLFISTAALVAFASGSMAAVTISLTGNPNTGPQFFLSEGSNQVVPDGSLIRIGTFDAAPSPNAPFTEYAATFHEFARTTMGNTVNQNTGRPVRNNIAGGSGPESPDPDSFFVGKNVFIWVYSNDAGDPAGVTNQGLFATTLTFADQPTALSTSTTGYVNAYGVNPSPLTGTQSSVVIDAATGLVTRFNLAAPIPEPASIVSLGLALTFGLARRRR